MSALEAYQRAHQSSPLAADVARFLLVNDSFPRSVLYCFRMGETQVEALAENGKPSSLRRLNQLRSGLEYADFNDMVSDLPGHLTALESGIREAANLVSAQFFRNAEAFDLHSQAISPGESL